MLDRRTVTITFHRNLIKTNTNKMATKNWQSSQPH